MEGRQARWWSVLTVRDDLVTAIEDVIGHHDAVGALSPKVATVP